VARFIAIPTEVNGARFLINSIANPVNMEAAEKSGIEALTRFIEE